MNEEARIVHEIAEKTREQERRNRHGQPDYRFKRFATDFTKAIETEENEGRRLAAKEKKEKISGLVGLAKNSQFLLS